MAAGKIRHKVKFAIDIVLLLALLTTYLLFEFVVPSFKRGFFCDDDSIRYPFNGNTISTLAIALVAILVPTATMLLVEFVRSLKCRQGVGKWKFSTWMVQCYYILRPFAFGGVTTMVAVDIAKCTMGRLRPVFWDVCDPNINCTVEEHLYSYITDFECRGNNTKMLKEMRLSFPSGHSAIAFYTFTFLAIYLHVRMTWKGSALLRHTIQFIVLMMAWFTSLSRVMDNMHHWSDAFAGGLLGVVAAIVTAAYVSDLPKRRIVNRNPEVPVDPNERSGIAANIRSGDFSYNSVSKTDETTLLQNI